MYPAEYRAQSTSFTEDDLSNIIASFYHFANSISEKRSIILNTMYRNKSAAVHIADFVPKELLYKEKRMFEYFEHPFWILIPILILFYPVFISFSF